SVSLPHCALTAPLICFQLPSTRSQFIEASVSFHPALEGAIHGPNAHGGPAVASADRGAYGVARQGAMSRVGSGCGGLPGQERVTARSKLARLQCAGSKQNEQELFPGGGNHEAEAF